jgi:DNA-binding response OmpR family regulator
MPLDGECRCPTCGQALKTIDGVMWDGRTATVTTAQGTVRLSPTHYRILTLLRDAYPRALPFEEIMSDLYDHRPGDPPLGSTLRVTVHYLRQKLKPSGLRIETIHGRAYRLVDLET